MNDMRTRQQTVRDLYAAYLEDRKDKVVAMLTEDFTFSSPRDDHIDRAAYFERCGRSSRSSAPSTSNSWRSMATRQPCGTAPKNSTAEASPTWRVCASAVRRLPP